MMKYYSFMLFALLFSANSYSQSSTDVHEFLSHFEKAVMQHKYKKVLKLTDTDYRKQQHDEFLQGNTTQFINELFSGYGIENAAFIHFKLTDINSLSVKQANKISETQYEISWLVVSQTKGSAVCTLYVVKNGKKWRVVGAVG